MPKRMIEKPCTFDTMLEQAQEWDGGFVVHTPDPTYTSFIDELLDEHFPSRDKTEYLGPEITDADIYRDLLAGEYVTPIDTVAIIEHKPPMQQIQKSEPTSFISIKSAFIGLADVEPDYTVIPIPEVEDTSS